MDTDALLLHWAKFASHWRGMPSESGDALLAWILDSGLGAWWPDDLDEHVHEADDPGVCQADVLACEVAILDASGLFDVEAYLAHNRDVAASGIDPLRHFCKFGWNELRNPNADFDLWWYWVSHLDATQEKINPLLHYVISGRLDGLAVHAEVPSPRDPVAYARGQRITRVCLFAGYDPDGLIDDYVVDYLRELSLHADVYYLADCPMQPGQLARIADFTVGAWAFRHGEYDFGSFSRLARDLVGWELIEQYDELILANDSCYLLRPLDQMFERMDASACDWWGLQMTKKNFLGDDPDHLHISLEMVRDSMLPETELSYVNSLHVSSYFVVYRKPIIDDTQFRRRLDGVTVQSSKSNIITKYEIGLSRYLISQNYRLDTFIADLHPYHPVYTLNHFKLIEQGFPLFKRLLLSNNPLDAPGLADWKQMLLERVPDAPVEMMERNLLRVADDDKLQRSFRITTAEDGSLVVPTLLEGRAFAAADVASPKFDHWWAFPVCAFDHGFAGNERAVFEEVRNDPSIRKIVLTRGKRIELEGENVVVVPLKSPEGQHYLLRSRQIFVKHGPRINVPFPLSPKLHNFINLWHGIPLKRFGYASLDMVGRLKWVADENRGCRAVISSSKVDTLAMAAAFYPLSYRDIWPTGLPRNDFVLCPPERLPADLRQQEQRLRDELRGRRLVLFLPTFKNAQEDGYYRFSGVELATLGDWLERNHAVLGVREHMADMARTYATMLAPLGILDLSSARYPNVEVLYRVGAALVTDYSSCVIDFMLTGRPVISFAYDYDNYANAERGLFYDLEFALPGPVCRDFGQLTEALETVFDVPDAQQLGNYQRKRRLFFDHCDHSNAWRVVKRVKQLYVDDRVDIQNES
ncbi:MAG: CDP-glycerol glycerophosphotransferase family protein [Luteimonas sp.]